MEFKGNKRLTAEQCTIHDSTQFGAEKCSKEATDKSRGYILD